MCMLSIMCVAHWPEEGLEKDAMLMRECANVYLSLYNGSIKQFDTEKHHAGAEAVWSYIELLTNNLRGD